MKETDVEGIRRDENKGVEGGIQRYTREGQKTAVLVSPIKVSVELFWVYNF